MNARFQAKNPPGGRLTPSNLSSTSTASTSNLPSSPSISFSNIESDPVYLERLKAREIISEAFLQVVRTKPDDPFDFLYGYFESQCQTKPYEKALTRLRLADPKHPSFESLLVELYSNFNALSDDILLLKGDVYNKLLESLCNNQIWSGSKDHRATLLSLVCLRPNDSVHFNVFKYGIQAILLAKG
ncbi:unnamed protein product [Rotaria socialis]|uniref:Tubulin polyglutamylase complex subunit 1-like C-terminal domain-containing protein n=1 Tax=Rotaria socialis TaxID=392032 RepID=A0A817UUK0_9BILA|nr:unnamed protein product [Rotaria socialis]CAF3334685.1 unnamed protein product [Rotaria socialis]CAF3373877.1 unnamed protein product [Rotaria socialis]CAF3435797.1 unnamed protein product [Rotaria socialis]CAF3515914.1 unnamed protein product [Rotaria socialis]